MENGIPVGTYRNRVFNSKESIEWDTVEGTYPHVTMAFRTSMCQQCENPPCIVVCPVNATSQREDGIVYIDKDLCIGCRLCEEPCPYEARSINVDSMWEEKCNMCMHRLDEGLVPMCSFCCPVQAITIGDLNDPSSEVAKQLAESETYQLLVEKGTGPTTYYI
jgi:molybdopterin-containing oxidoreductase family iron-sulfur binding subunit/tetrathionate reductase subunit B